MATFNAKPKVKQQQKENYFKEKTCHSEGSCKATNSRNRKRSHENGGKTRKLGKIKHSIRL